MKKIINSIFVVFLAVIIVFSFSGCFGNNTKEATPTLPVTTKNPNHFYPEFAVNTTTAEAVVDITTNFPVGTLFTINVASPSAEYTSSQEVAVTKSGELCKIITKPFTKDSGEKLEEGKYRIKYTMVVASKQPASVQKIIGAKGELLDGANVFQDTKTTTSFYQDTVVCKLSNGIFTND